MNLPDPANRLRCFLRLHRWVPGLSEISDGTAVVSPLGACMRQRCVHCPADKPLSLRVALRFKSAAARK